MFSENSLYLSKHRIATAKEDLDTAIVTIAIFILPPGKKR